MEREVASLSHIYTYIYAKSMEKIIYGSRKIVSLNHQFPSTTVTQPACTCVYIYNAGAINNPVCRGGIIVQIRATAMRLLRNGYMRLHVCGRCRVYIDVSLDVAKIFYHCLIRFWLDYILQL